MGGARSIPEVKKEDWKDIALRAHNKIRKRHNALPLQYSKDLSMYAQNHALYLRNRSNLIRSGRYCQGEYIGENISEKFVQKDGKYEGEEVTDDWYNEIEHYSYFEGDPPNDIKQKCRNFTQLIWKNTTEVGFGVAKKGSRVIVVACYKPRGNTKGDYQENVLPRLIIEQERRFSNCLAPKDED